MIGSKDHPRWTVIALMSLGLALLPSVADAQLKWEVAPYLWVGNISVRADIDEIDAIDRTKNFANSSDDTDFTGMGYFQVRADRYGAFADVAFLNLGSSEGTLTVNPPGPSTVTGIETDLKTTLFDAVVFYRPGGGDDGLDVFVGLRYLDVDQKLNVTYTGGTDVRLLQVDENLINGIAGIRYVKRIVDRWDVNLRLDAGAGDAELTWNAQAGAGWWFNDNMALRFGYKYTELKFESDVEDPFPTTDPRDINVDSKLEFSGPFAGVLFRF